MPVTGRETRATLIAALPRQKIFNLVLGRRRVRPGGWRPVAEFGVPDLAADEGQESAEAQRHQRRDQGEPERGAVQAGMLPQGGERDGGEGRGGAYTRS